MIWNYIMDFLIQYVYGGVTTDGQVYYAFLFRSYDSDSFVSTHNYQVTTPVYATPMPLGNYLAIITTIIIMALIVWFAIWLVIWVFKLVAHAFLLK